MPAILQCRDAACPRVFCRPSLRRGGLYRLRHEVYHRRFGQPGHQGDGVPGRQHRDAPERLPGIAGIQPPARAEFRVG